MAEGALDQSREVLSTVHFREGTQFLRLEVVLRDELHVAGMQCMEGTIHIFKNLFANIKSPIFLIFIFPIHIHTFY